MTPSDAWDRLGLAYADREAAARQRKADGRKVVGVLGGTVPVELITAAGLLPVRLVGDPEAPTPDADRWMEPVREASLRSILQKLMTGGYDFLDLIVVPRSSEGLLQFFYLVEHIRQVEAGLEMPPLHLFDLLQTPTTLSVDYVEQRVIELGERLAQFSGTAVTADALGAAIDLHNEVRARFGALDAQRRARLAVLPGTAALQLAGCGQTLPPEDFLALADAVGHARPRRTDGAVRIALSGCPFEHTGFYRLVEEQAAMIVVEDHDWGAFLYRHPVQLREGPHRALAERYVRHAPSPRRFPEGGRAEAIERLMQDASPDAVIFAYEKGDDTLGWDYPMQRRRLEELGVPSLRLTGVGYGQPDPQTSDRVAGFIKEITP